MDEKRCNVRMINIVDILVKMIFRCRQAINVAIKKLHSSTIIGRQFDNEQKLPTAFLC